MFPSIWIEEAQKRISPHIRNTPLHYDEELDLYVKWENKQLTGSFKLRGAINKILSLQPWEVERGIVSASAGNHGQGVALAANMVHSKSIIFASEHAVPAKLEAIRNLGAEVRLVSGGYGEAEQAGIEYASRSGAIWVSPYNDGQVIAGQGTIGWEIIQSHNLAGKLTWVVPAGGGGLIAGIGAAIKTHPKDTDKLCLMKLAGVQSEASPYLYNLYHHGTQAGCQELPSLADGLAGPVEDGSLTIPLVRRYVDDFVLVSESEIVEAIRFAWQRYNERIEGSAATALAAALTGKIPERPAMLIITGGNIQPEIHQQIVTGQL